MAVSLGVFAQGEGPKVVVNLDGFRYPPIATGASIQGEVLVEGSATDRRVISGSPILASAALKNLETWTFPPSDNITYLARYHFALVGKVCEPSSTALPARYQWSRHRRTFVADVYIAATRRCSVN